MVQTIKSVLLLDYDSVYRSLSSVEPEAGNILGPRAGLWLEAIENGDVIESANVGEDLKRRFQTKRCYASPEVLGKNRGWLTANGLQVIDCSVPVGLTNGSGDIHMVLDALDAVEAEPDEIILATARTDLTPLLFRLRALNQRVIIYATRETAASYKTFADGVLSEERLIAALTQPAENAVIAGKGSIPRPPRIAMPQAQARPKREAVRAPEPTPAPEQRRKPEPTPRREPEPESYRPIVQRGEARPARQPVDREALASLVRRIHQATNVPLFSPRAFSDLFRLLAAEVARTGYKFQTNSDNVASEMNKLGRNVSKRQVGFVIKGLALRGHVFTPQDAPEELAEAFYQQVLFLVANSKLDLDDDEKGLIQAWIVGTRNEAGPAAQPAATDAPPEQEAPRSTAGSRQSEAAPKTAERPASRTRRQPDERSERSEQPVPRSHGSGRQSEQAPRRRPAEDPQPEIRARHAAPEPADLPPEPEDYEPFEDDLPEDDDAPQAEIWAEPEDDPPPRERTSARREAVPQPSGDRSRAGQRGRQAPEREPERPPMRTTQRPVRPAPTIEPDEPRLAESSFASRVGRNGAAAAPRVRPPPPADPMGEAELEDSILSAIADAVDVLADDGTPGRSNRRREQPEAEQAPRARQEPQQPAAEPFGEDDSDEIGDEIQRILASYGDRR